MGATGNGASICTPNVLILSISAAMLLVPHPTPLPH